MPLVDRIDKALDSGVDPDAFERAAVALLQDRYRWLSPVEAGKDLGRDADIYRTAADDREGRGRLLATTGDPLANVKRSHKSWLREENFRVDALVVACSNDITGTTRRKIDQYCRDHDLPLPEYYGRDWLVDALLRAPDWRESLTGIRGRLDALRPAKSLAQAGQSTLVARGDELALLNAAISGGRDVILSGVPGAGKSRLLCELDVELLVVEPRARDYLVDDLVAQGPAGVAVDDAHLHLDLLAELARVRAQEALSFAIVASTWPEQENSVSELLPQHARVDLGLLARADMDVIVQEAGVTGVHARRLVLDQAEGRPGWAAALCDSFVDGDGDKVASGKALLDQVERHLRVAADSATTLDALACIAALGRSSSEDLERIADLVRVSPASLVDALYATATLGLLDYREGNWSLQPALRPPLVSRWFFGPRRSRSWNSVRQAFADRSSDLDMSLLVAARKAPGRDIADLAHAWAANLPDPDAWDLTVLRLVVEYGVLDEEAADFSSRGARALLSAERPMKPTAWGSLHDPIGSAAKDVLVTCLHAWLNREAIHGLLDLAIDDDRPRPQSPDHPLRLLGEMAGHLDPDRGPAFPVRRLVLSNALEWQADAQDRERRTVVFAEVVRYCFSPGVQGTWSDPATHRSITIANGVESPEHLEDLIRLWTEVRDWLQADGQSVIGVEALRHFIELWEEWLRLAAGHSGGASSVTAEQREAGATGAWTLLGDIAPMLNTRPGLALRAQRALDLAERWNLIPPANIPSLDMDADLLLFAGRREPWDSAEKWIEERSREQGQLAQRLKDLGPDSGSELFQRLAVESASASDHGETGDLVARRLAELTEGTSDWIHAAIRVGSGTLLHQHVWRARQLGRRPLKLAIVDGLMNDRSLRAAIVGAVLEAGPLDEFGSLVISNLDASDAWQLERLFVKVEPDEILRALLLHPVRDVRAAAALSFAVGVDHGPALPDQWVTEWEEAFLDADATTVHGHTQWRLQEILRAMPRTNPTLCASWFERRLVENQSGLHGARLRDVEHVARSLPQPHREHLARITGASDATLALSLLPELVGHDADLAARLVHEGVLDSFAALDALSGERDEGVAVLAPVLLAHGIQAERIARKICGHRSWVGNESDAIQADIAWFEDLAIRQPELQPVSDAAIRYLTSELEAAVEEERSEEIQGW